MNNAAPAPMMKIQRKKKQEKAEMPDCLEQRTSVERVNSVPVRDEELTIPLMSDATSSDELKPDDGDEEAERKGSDQETYGDEGKAEEEKEGVYESLQEYLAFVEDAETNLKEFEKKEESGDAENDTGEAVEEAESNIRAEGKKEEVGDEKSKWE
ncbi:hypothetical protein DAPPUDRAFT_331641 [Daphnia pulex]|uniref:Uncharacterized protein n=1 Tax=Daphnia pulex TaxID=6669 RepID=E9HN03_DAPPU|nr:hypothetical protein DAPPUDRAFT_331641 [Daphnia pulex]|eukprot:EFX66842.1 hypothetical protein DAPPUDRAFT_331641 [Daphnia pulex]